MNKIASPSKNSQYFVNNTNSINLGKTNRKLLSTSATEFPNNSVLNNFEFHKNCTQNQFFNQDLYRSKPNLLNLNQKKIEINNNYLILNNRINLLKKKKKFLKQKCDLKTNEMKIIFEKQRAKSEIFQEKKKVFYFLKYICLFDFFFLDK